MENSSTLTATTPGGKSVLLRSDGTWAFQASPVRQPDSGVGFRKMAWGASKAEVIAAENRDDYEEADSFLAFTAVIAGLPCSVIYVFVGDSLVRGKLAFTVQHANDNDFWDDFEALKSMLIKKYGSPGDDQTIWKSDTYKDNPNERGMAVSCGDLVRLVSWDLEETHVSLVLSGDNYEIELAIHYKSKSIGHMEDEQMEQLALDEL
jgi:hypothetical protein